MQTHLDTLNLVDVLTDDPSYEAVAKTEFLKRDKRAKERIGAHVHNDCLGYIRDQNTAKAMWKHQEAVFPKRSAVIQILLRKQLGKLRMNEGDSVAAHLLCFESLVRELKISGAKMEEAVVLTQLFLTLPEKFDPFVTALQNLDEDKLTFNTAQERLLLEEIKFSGRQDEEPSEKTAFVGKKFTKKFKGFKGKCFKYQKFGHRAKDCRGGEAHVAANGVCFMADRNPVDSRSGKRQQVTFKLDSGASDHMAKEDWYFSKLQDLPTVVQINIAKDDQSIAAERSGNIKGWTNQGINVNIKNVLLVPKLRDNLLSVRKLTYEGIQMKFC